MPELDPSLLRQPTETDRPNAIEVLNSMGIYSSEGFPFFARSKDDYRYVGQLVLEPYERGDSPSRDNSDAPYNATWFEHLRHHYSGALKLLEGLRQAYIQEFLPSSDESLDSEGILDIYYMGIQLPNYLMWRKNSPVKNGEVPPEMSVLRQALLGVGTVILSDDPERLTQLSGKDIADIAEQNGDLIGEETALTKLPVMVCPASPEMIAGLGEALLSGNEKRGVGTLIEDYDVDVARLRQFVKFLHLHTAYEAELLKDIEALCEELPSESVQFSLQRPRNKVERYDELIKAYGAFLDTETAGLYAALGRTDSPPRMNARRIFKTRKDLLFGRVKALQSDDLNLYTQEVIDEFHLLLPSLPKK